MSHTHTTSAAPAPALSPATVALSSIANSIITLLHSPPASPELLFYLNGKDLTALRAVAPGVSTFLKGRKEALDRYLVENEAKEVRVSEKTKAFWLEKKRETEDLLTALDEADKGESELSESGRKAREEYFEKAKAAWEVGLADVLDKLNKDLAVPFALGEQISIVDLHLAAWLCELVILSGGSVRDSGTVAIARLEEHVGGGFALAKDVAPPQLAPVPRSMGSEGPAPASTASAPKSKLAVLWDALAARTSWQKVLSNLGE